MSTAKPKEIDPKTLYLIKTLSRTRRKDYENYVINAIWQRLADNDIEVVSQQYVEGGKNGRSHYFIDLYFPSLEIGIECDEAYHKNQSARDKEREVTIFDVLHGIKAGNSKLKLIRIDVTGSFDKLQTRINKAVEIIKQRIADRNHPRWIITAEEYYKNKCKISIRDRKGFKTIKDALNILFKAGYKGGQRAEYAPAKFNGTPLEGCHVWFPQLAIRDENNKLITPKGINWNNQLMENGKRIEMRNVKGKSSFKPDGIKRIVFAKNKDALGNNEYIFVGIFECVQENDGLSFYFNRIQEDCDLIKQ